MKNKLTESERLTVRICPQLRHRVTKVARRLNLSEAWVVKHCLEKSLPELERKKYYYLAA